MNGLEMVSIQKSMSLQIPQKKKISKEVHFYCTV